MKTSILLLASVIGLAGCVGGMQDEVIARSDELSRRPEWVKDDGPIMVKNGDMFVTGMVEASNLCGQIKGVAIGEFE